MSLTDNEKLEDRIATLEADLAAAEREIQENEYSEYYTGYDAGLAAGLEAGRAECMCGI